LRGAPLYNRHGSSRDLNINPFTMVLNGVIDAAVAGGVAMYQKAFLTPAYASANPGDMPLINKLKNNILYQVDILEKGTFSTPPPFVATERVREC